MKEVTGPQLRELQITIQNMPITGSKDIQWRLVRAWEVFMLDNITYYKVEIINNIMVPLRGILIWPVRELYLDMPSMLFLVEERITMQLDAFNAGYHWRYKGL